MSTGFTFGAKTTAAPTFGTPSFGTPQAQPQQQFGFGTPASTAPSLFGQPATTTASLGFKPAGFGFGTTPATTTTATIAPQPNSGFSFGTPASSAPATAITFGTPTGLNFGTPSVSTGLSFGTPTTTTTATALGFGTPSFGLATSTPSTGLGFGLGTSTAPTLNFNSTPATTTGLSFGLGGIAPATSTTTTGFGLNLTTTTTPQQSVGLGGIPPAQSKTGTTATTQKEVPPKEQTVPNEILQTVEQFKNLIQEEKNRSSEVARCSVKEFHKVGNELDSLNYQLNQLENQLQTYRKLAEQLKYDTVKSLQNIEIAQRTQDTPPGLQYDNNAPLQFFLELAENFEREMQFLKTKIDNTEKYVKKYGESNVLTSQDLAVGLKQLHETFVALAGRMQSIHNQVETQKENYLNFRKHAYRDFINPFETTQKLNETVNSIMKNTLITPPKLASGPTPFNNISLGASNLVLTQQQNPNATTGLGK